jgi:saccharopine dehydrogenase-like NADP-dependent oxidoreductase
VVVNCTQHDFNLHVMKAALIARIHYVDLGGLFHWTRRQLKLNHQFKDAGLTALLGMGCAPGITNVMARYASGGLRNLQSIKIRVGSIDCNAKPGAFYFPYSAQTVVEELTLAPWIFQEGKFRRIRPRTGWELVAFPAPVGEVWTVRTRHSEIATLPPSFRAKNLRHCDFKVSFDRHFVKELVRRLRSGWSVKQLAALPAPRAEPNDYEVARVIVTGRQDSNSERCMVTMDCCASANADWHASAGDVDTGRPLSVAAQMIATGTVAQRGVLPPESAVPAEDFFDEMKRRGLKFSLHHSSHLRIRPGEK